MKGPCMILMCGIPGCGKSTLAKKLVGYRISTDNLRKALLGDISNVGQDKLIFAVARSAARYFLKHGETVIIDATNLRRDKRGQFIRIAKKVGVWVKLILIDCPLDVALTRNALRERKVPENVLRALYQSFQPPRLEEGIDVIEVRDNNLNLKEIF